MTASPQLARESPSTKAWDGEERIVREAILMVASHGAPRVLVAGLTLGEQILDACRRSALEAGVRLRVRPTSRDDRIDLVIEAVH